MSHIVQAPCDMMSTKKKLPIQDPKTSFVWSSQIYVNWRCRDETHHLAIDQIWRLLFKRPYLISENRRGAWHSLPISDRKVEKLILAVGRTLFEMIPNTFAISWQLKCQSGSTNGRISWTIWADRREQGAFFISKFRYRNRENHWCGRSLTYSIFSINTA